MDRRQFLKCSTITAAGVALMQFVGPTLEQEAAGISSVGLPPNSVDWPRVSLDIWGPSGDHVVNEWLTDPRDWRLLFAPKMTVLYEKPLVFHALDSCHIFGAKITGVAGNLLHRISSWKREGYHLICGDTFQLTSIRLDIEP